MTTGEQLEEQIKLDLKGKPERERVTKGQLKRQLEQQLETGRVASENIGIVANQADKKGKVA